MDSYQALEGEVIQLTSFVRNIAGGSITFVIQPWITHDGPRTMGIILAVLVGVINLTSVAFQIWGKEAQRRTVGADDMLVFTS